MVQPGDAMRRRLRWYGRTDPGHVRPNNEDSFLALRFNAQEIHHLGKTGESALTHHDHVFAVSDGMGGEKAGEFASRITMDKIAHLLPRSFKQAALGLPTPFEDIFTELYDQIHRALSYVGWGDEEVHGMQATLTMCWFTPGWLGFAHIGDSRLYYLPASGKDIRQLSLDDTYVGWLFRTGQINERQAREHPRRTALQKALGGGNQFIDPQVGVVAYEPGDLFLLCTDGVTDGHYHEQLFRLLRQPDAAESRSDPAQRLVESAVANAGRDNTTALVVEVLDS